MKKLKISQIASLAELYAQRNEDGGVEPINFFMPLVLDLYDPSLNMMKQQIKEIFPKDQTVLSILDYANGHNFININRNAVEKTDSGIQCSLEYQLVIRQLLIDWTEFKSYLCFYYENNFLEKLDPSTIDEKIIYFLNKPFVELLKCEKYNSFKPFSTHELSKTETVRFIDFICHILENKKEFSSLLIKIAKGIASTYSILLSFDSNVTDDNVLPFVYYR